MSAPKIEAPTEADIVWLAEQLVHADGVAGRGLTGTADDLRLIQQTLDS